MDPRDQDDAHDLSFAESLLGRIVMALGTLFSAGYLLFGEYRPQTLGALVAMFFGAYVWLRVMLYLENNRFSPKRYRVGVTWALVGIDNDTSEFDIRPVRVYFLLLSALLCGLVLRPIVQVFV